jgi:hypothetical protein
LVFAGPQKVNTEGLVHPCRPCGTDFLLKPSQHLGEKTRAFVVSPSHGKCGAPHQLTPGGNVRVQRVISGFALERARDAPLPPRWAPQLKARALRLNFNLAKRPLDLVSAMTEHSRVPAQLPRGRALLVVDLSSARKLSQLCKAPPDSRVFYAVKATLRLSSWRPWSRSAPASIPPRSRKSRWWRGRRDGAPHSFGNTIKEARHCARYALGVRLFAVDCRAEVDRSPARAPAVRDLLRFCSTAPALVAASRKFGCDVRWPSMCRGFRCGLEPQGVSFHVGSQQRRTQAWDDALKSAGDFVPAPSAESICHGQSRRLPHQIPE